MERLARWRELKGVQEGGVLMITAVFLYLNALILSLAVDGAVRLAHFWALGGWTVAMAAAFAILQWRKPRHDPFLLPLYGLLTGWGLLLVDRLAANFLLRQTVWVLLGTVVLCGVAVLPSSLRWLRRYRYTWLVGGLLLLALTLLLGVNPTGFGAALWLPIPLTGSIFFQPSELLKLLLVIFFASYFHEREPLLRRGQENGRFGAVPYLLPLLLMWGFCILLLVWQRDLGAAAIFFFLFLGLLYLATGEAVMIWLGLGLLMVASTVAYFLFDVVALRVNAWLNPWLDPSGSTFQIVQSLYALAAGGVLGQGLGLGQPDFIPVVHSDFVFAAIVEEWGLIGGLAVLACFALLAQRGLRIGLLGKRPFYLYLAVGITLLFSTQAVLIMGGVTKLLPLTGVTLPFVSYGGSSMLMSSLMLGLLLFLSGENRTPLR